MFTKYAFHLVIEVYSWITTLILQFHLNIALELIKLREYRYQRDFKNLIGQSLFTKSRFDIPLLSGQTRLKSLKSTDGRSLSIGMQYLSSKPCEISNCRYQKEQTISRAIDASAASPATYDGQNLALS
jgi:hypothetical protein